jgi:hypothetical protein
VWPSVELAERQPSRERNDIVSCRVAENVTDGDDGSIGGDSGGDDLVT